MPFINMQIHKRQKDKNKLEHFLFCPEKFTIVSRSPTWAAEEIFLAIFRNDFEQQAAKG